MRYLFVHQNFPGQYRHVAPALVRAGHEVVALSVGKPRQKLAGVRHVSYAPTPISALAPDTPQRAAMAEWHAKVARGHAAAAAMKQLRRAGFLPDFVAVHPGWGEALFVRDVFPAAHLQVYAEYFYGAAGGDTDFDPEFPRSIDEAGDSLRIKNTHLLHALNDCDSAVSPTQFQRERHPLWSQDRIQVVHDGIDTGRFRPNLGASVRLKAAGVMLSAADEVVTFACRNLEPYRGCHVLMRALPLLQKLRPRARVVIVGADGTSYGPKPPAGKTWKHIFLSEVVRKLDMSRVHFVGQVPHHLLTQLMQISRLHVYLTYPFVLSWSLLEAMSIGCLVLGSDTAPVREVIVNGRNGLLTDFFDARQLALSAAQALEDAPHLTKLRQAARKTVLDRFDLRRMCLPEHLSLLGAGTASSRQIYTELVPSYAARPGEKATSLGLVN